MPSITIHNKTICYQTTGDSANPPVICVMGIMGQLIHWPPEFTEDLADAGFYVITFDNRDVGLSSYYDHLDTPVLSDALAAKAAGRAFKPPYTLKDMSEDILNLMDGLTIQKAHLIGLSMGGQIAQWFAIKYPDRLLSLTLITTSSGDRNLPPPKPEVLDFFFQPKKANDLSAALRAHIAQYKLYHHPDDFDLETVAKLHQEAHERAYHPAGNQRQLLAMIFAEPRGEQLEKINVPTLVIHGDYDPVVSVEHGNQLTEIIPNAHLEIIEKMGHGITAKNAVKIVEIFRNYFLKDHIELVPYDPNWLKSAEDEIKILRKVLPVEQTVDIQHVGSTAIPGMPAKPIIDIQIAVDDLEKFKKSALDSLKKLEYVFWDKNPDKDRLFFVKGMPPFGKKRTHHLHVVEPDSNHWKNKLLFRDYLIAHPEIAKDYKQLKQRLASQYAYDRERYTEEKTAFIKRILEKTNNQIQDKEKS